MKVGMDGTELSFDCNRGKLAKLSSEVILLMAVSRQKQFIWLFKMKLLSQYQAQVPDRMKSAFISGATEGNLCAHANQTMR